MINASRHHLSGTWLEFAPMSSWRPPPPALRNVAASGVACFMQLHIWPSHQKTKPPLPALPSRISFSLFLFCPIILIFLKNLLKRFGHVRRGGDERKISGANITWYDKNTLIWGVCMFALPSWKNIDGYLWRTNIVSFPQLCKLFFPYKISLRLFNEYELTLID